MNLFNQIIFESLEWDLNPRPTDLQSAVLPTELSRDIDLSYGQLYLHFLFISFYFFNKNLRFFQS